MGKGSRSYPKYSDILSVQLKNVDSAGASAEVGVESGNPPDDRVEIQGEDRPTERTASHEADGRLPKRKKKKKDKSPERSSADAGGEAEQRVEVDPPVVTCVVDVRKEMRTSRVVDSTDPVVSSGSKRKGSNDADLGDPTRKRLRESIVCPLDSPQRMGSSMSRLPWGGANPPSARALTASSEHWNFRHGKDTSFVNDQDSCADLSRRIRGGTRMMPEANDLAFPDKFKESARADMVISFICVVFILVMRISI